MYAVLLVLLIHVIRAQLNLYLDSHPVHKLFDIRHSQLYFIHENELRPAALQSSLQISANIPSIEFTWNGGHAKMDTAQLHYEYNASTANEQAMLAPVLNIIDTGMVPGEVSTFSIFFPCLLSTAVNCSIVFRFYNTTAANVSTLVPMKFFKYCRDETVDRSLLSQFYNSDQINDFFSIRESRHQNFSSITIATVLAYSLIIALVVFLLVFCTAMSLFCLYRMTTTKKVGTENLTERAQLNPALPLTFDMTTMEDVSLYSCTQYDFMKTADELLSSTAFADCTFDQNRLTLHELILEGKYGRVLHCSLHDAPTDGSTQNIYGKTVSSTATPSQLSQMLHDCCLFATLQHSNLSSPLGIVYKDDLSPYPLIVYPYSNRGILKRFLSNNRTSAREQMLSTQELVFMGIHVAKGLHFLHRRKLLMKDIGARNCLVMEDLTVKLTDYALARDLFPEDYDCLPTDDFNEKRPLKFMAMESILDRRFSTASDVWSYGVLLWEVMSRGLQPYADLPASDLVGHLQNNCRLVQPINCPDSLFKIMSVCWILSIDQRPSMTSLLQSLMEFYGQLARFI